jgi:hypothetical protein
MNPLRMRSIVLLAGLAAAIIVISAVPGAVWFVLAHREAHSASASAASIEFEQLRARFAHDEPLLDMRRRATAADVKTSRVTVTLHAFHTVVFDTSGGDRVIRMTVPYWFGRRYARHDGRLTWLGELTFLDDTEFDPERIRLSLDEIEHRGPGLLVDYRHPGGGQFMAWVE